MKTTVRTEWEKHALTPGEVWAGVVKGKEGERDHHLILLPGEAEKVNHAQAIEFAKKAGGELPNRREQALLYANCKEEFTPNWYWSSETHASDGDYAWLQDFSHGGQGNGRKSYDGRARAVRRIPIE